MAKLLWEWKPRYAVALVVRGLLIVTSQTNCDVTSCPVVMRRYANADWDEQRYKTSKTQVSLAFCKIKYRGKIEIDHLYGLRCRGWYCNPEQHSLCRPARPHAAAPRPAQLVLFRIAVPTTPAQTVSWSIPITTHGYATCAEFWMINGVYVELLCLRYLGTYMNRARLRHVLHIHERGCVHCCF